jgi:4-hydroxybenzoate polyprenyltransferase
MEVRDYLLLMRPNQWYKNLVVFAPIVFSRGLLDFSSAFAAILAFVALCFLSSGNYTINDIVDLKEDQIHPEKKLRPLANGRVGAWSALLFALLLYATGGAIAVFLGTSFLLIALLLVAGGLVYSLLFKRMFLADLIVISSLFVLRVLAGSILIQAQPSLWLLSSVFSLALFAAVLKRRADLNVSLKKSAAHNLRVLQPLSAASLALLLLSYMAFSFFSTGRSPIFLLSIPIVFFASFRYYSLSYSNPSICRRPEKFYRDFPLFCSILSWLSVVLLDAYIFGVAG